MELVKSGLTECSGAFSLVSRNISRVLPTIASRQSSCKAVLFFIHFDSAPAPLNDRVKGVVVMSVLVP